MGSFNSYCTTILSHPNICDFCSISKNLLFFMACHTTEPSHYYQCARLMLEEHFSSFDLKKNSHNSQLEKNWDKSVSHKEGRESLE
jgi:hypothetical protein